MTGSNTAQATRRRPRPVGLGQSTGHERDAESRLRRPLRHSHTLRFSITPTPAISQRAPRSLHSAELARPDMRRCLSQVSLFYFHAHAPGCIPFCGPEEPSLRAQCRLPGGRPPSCSSSSRITFCRDSLLRRYSRRDRYPGIRQHLHQLGYCLNDPTNTFRVSAALGQNRASHENGKCRTRFSTAHQPGGRLPLAREAVEARSPTSSPSSGEVYGLALVCRVWRMPRATIYRHRAMPAATPPRRCGPVGPMADAALLVAIRAILAASPFHGEGHRKNLGQIAGCRRADL